MQVMVLCPTGDQPFYTPNIFKQQFRMLNQISDTGIVHEPAGDKSSLEMHEAIT